MSNIPEDLVYSEQHLWLERQSDNSYRAGITDFAQEELGDIVFVELPELERSFAQDDECALVESVKSASDLYCPLAGEIVEINPEVEENPEKINTDPYGDGWIFRLMPNDDADMDALMDAEAYGAMIEEN